MVIKALRRSQNLRWVLKVRAVKYKEPRFLSSAAFTLLIFLFFNKVSKYRLTYWEKKKHTIIALRQVYNLKIKHLCPFR